MGQLLTDIFNNSLCWKMTNLGSNQGAHRCCKHLKKNEEFLGLPQWLPKETEASQTDLDGLFTDKVYSSGNGQYLRGEITIQDG